MESTGRYLRRERELRRVSLEELAQTTRIPLKMLVSIEDDRFDKLPGEVFARGFLRSYAQALGIDSEDVLAVYGQGRRALVVNPAPITAITPPERGKRFGIAIALVVLLILFTLALSIVLRPRQRDTAIELSFNSCPLEPSSPMQSSFAPSITESRTASSRS
ncbi:MAG: helix-turn-helix domain-containing protein [Sandaracinaceae bacterium]|nr:helix-turn-helix domain-containing protein [Sandaracinaceae bacterium]